MLKDTCFNKAVHSASGKQFIIKEFYAYAKVI